MISNINIKYQEIKINKQWKLDSLFKLRIKKVYFKKKNQKKFQPKCKKIFTECNIQDETYEEILKKI